MKSRASSEAHAKWLTAFAAAGNRTGMTSSLLERYDRVRRRTREIFASVAPEAFDQRPIPLRHPIRFYEGHLASFNFGMLLQGGAVSSDPDPALTQLFARGIDPLDQQAAERASISTWPDRATVAAYDARVDKTMRDAFSTDIDPIFLHTALEHEEMHQETLMYLIHRLPPEMKRERNGVQRTTTPRSRPVEWIRINGGTARMGVEPGTVPFGWDNEFPSASEEVAEFEIASHKVTNGEYLEFVQAGGYQDEQVWDAAAWRFLQSEGITAPQYWKQCGDTWQYDGLFAPMPLPLDWPVYVSHVEAVAFARWRGCRLPTEAEWHLAAEQAPAPERERDSFDFATWNPVAVATNGAGLSQMVGNGWEWTSTVFAGFPGFQPFAHYPGYSADFFDGRHFVLKGASPVTPAELVRPSFRNGFQDQYRHAYTAFRCARDV